MFYMWDPTLMILLPALLLTGYAQMKIQGTYYKYSQVPSRRGMTGAEAAARILQMSGIRDVQIQHVAGDLTDHYDPRKKVLSLSDTVYGSTSVAAIGVAAHECGHALQHQQGYAPLKLRSLLVPAANLGSRLGLPLVILGLALGLSFELPGGGYFSLAQIGIWIFSFAVLFQVVTLPVEFNASGRALRMLGDYGILNGDEVD